MIATPALTPNAFAVAVVLVLGLAAATDGLAAGPAAAKGTTAAQPAPTPAAAVADVPIPYVPSPQSVVERMLELAEVDEHDMLIDLGSGDGRIPITAAVRYGARGLGVDIDAGLVELATRNARAAGVEDRVSFRTQDLFETDLSEASVLSLYLPTAVNEALRPRLLKELRPGSRIIAHQFALGDWDADIRETLNNRHIHLWIVPAKVQGTWAVTAGSDRFDLHIAQTYQKLQVLASQETEGARASSTGTVGTLLTPGAGHPQTAGTVLPSLRHFGISDVLLRGDEIDFTVSLGDRGDVAFRGRVSGERIEPRAEDGDGLAEWEAVRISDRTRPEGMSDEYWWPQQVR